MALGNLQLFFGQQFGIEPIQRKLFGGSFGVFLPVAGEHHRTNIHLFQCCKGGGAVLLQGIRNQNVPGVCSIYRNIESTARFRGSLRGDAGCNHQLRISHKNVLSLYGSAHAHSGKFFVVFHRKQRSFAGFLHRKTQRVSAVEFRRGGNLQQLFFSDSPGADPLNLEITFGQRAGLIENRSFAF